MSFPTLPDQDYWSAGQHTITCDNKQHGEKRLVITFGTAADTVIIREDVWDQTKNPPLGGWVSGTPQAGTQISVTLNGTTPVTQGLGGYLVWFGTSASETFNPGGSTPIIAFGFGGDILWGEGGDDKPAPKLDANGAPVVDADGNPVMTDRGLFGGEGNDKLNGGPGGDLLHGEEGEDLLIEQASNSADHVDILDGGEGRDTLDAWDDNHSVIDVVHGKAGEDTFYADDWDDCDYAGPPADVSWTATSGSLIDVLNWA